MKKVIGLAIFLVIIIVATLVIIRADFAQPKQEKQNFLFISSYIPEQWGLNVTSGDIVLVNPTSTSYDNLNMTIKVDDSDLILPDLRLWHFNVTLQVTPNRQETGNYSIPISTISINPNQNETINVSVPSLETSLLTSHNLRIYLSQNKFGDVIDGQSIVIPQVIAYLQINEFSQVETNNNTWHEYYNSTTGRNEYINDQPNFCQQYFQSSFYPLDPQSYNWAFALNQLDETYFNVTVYNNNTFPVKALMLLGGSSPNIQSYMNSAYLASANSNDIIQPNETYVFPVPLTTVPQYGSVIGNLISNQTNFIQFP